MNNTANTQTPAPSAPKKRILIVDDEGSVTRMIKLNLEAAGPYQVRMENAAGRAVAAALEFEPDLVFLDVMMPAMDGGQVAGMIHNHPRLKSVPIVFLTAAVTKTEVRNGGGWIGGLPFLAKPVDTQEMIDCIQRHLPAQ